MASSQPAHAGQGDDSKQALNVAILIDDLRNDDVQVRLNSVRMLKFIAEALGEERTRNELIPYLNEFIDDEDDILLALAEELGDMIASVGGALHVHSLLVPLETLAGVEESVVRDKAVEAIKKVVVAMPEEYVFQHVFPMLGRLATGEWFTSRISAAALFTITYPRVHQDVQSKLREMYCSICHDETPMVRRAAASHLGEFCGVVGREFVESQLLQPFVQLAEDFQDSVRLITVDNCVAVSKAVSASVNKSGVLPIVKALAQDKSWRVRYMAADKFPGLLSVAQRCDEKEPLYEEMTECYVALLNNQEAEVRTAAASRLADVAKIIGSEATLKHLIGPCVDLSNDESQYTRAALASQIMGLASALAKRADTVDKVLPIFLTLLKDPHPEVRLNIISKLDTVNSVIGVNLLTQSLLPAIVDLAMDQKWRIRAAIIGHMPLLAKQMGTQFFEEKLSDLCMDWLGDTVHSIREAATQNLERLAEVFGADWAGAHILPKIVQLSTNNSYLYRMTALKALTRLSSHMGSELAAKQMLPVMVRLSGDTVPNVRFNVAKGLQELAPHLDASVVQSDVAPTLSKLMQDPDPDVQYYASEAYKTCS